MVRPIGIAYQNVRRRVWPGDGCPGIQDTWYNGGDRSSLTAAEVARCVGPYSDQGMWTDLADFFKLRSASLTYRLPEGLVPGTRSAQIGISGKNLLTFTDYRGLDPEANDNGFGDSTPNEYYNMAPPRVFILNMSLQLLMRRMEMTAINRKTRLGSAFASAAFGALLLSACDLEVLNPGRILDEDLNTRELMPIIVSGASAEFNDIVDDYSFDIARLTDDLAGTGSYFTTGKYRRGVIDSEDGDVETAWEQAHETAHGRPAAPGRGFRTC